MGRTNALDDLLLFQNSEIRIRPIKNKKSLFFFTVLTTCLPKFEIILLIDILDVNAF